MGTQFAMPSPDVGTQEKMTLSRSIAEEAMRRVDQIDLSMVKLKLMDEEEGQGWDQAFVDHVEKRYRRYLTMIIVTPDGSPVPTQDIDLFWHQHILDTRAYAKDCDEVIGYFVHHFPYFGMRGDEDAQNLQDAFEETKLIYSSLFGENYTTPDDSGAEASTCHKGPNNCHKCKSGCGMKCTQCKST